MSYFGKCLLCLEYATNHHYTLHKFVKENFKSLRNAGSDRIKIKKKIL